MGLFGSLFEKKICSICGEEIKLLGNRKLEDGNMCKTCANKLSPWFSERRSSTVDEINEQLAYREENKTQVENFNVTRTLGQSTKVLLDENQRKFIVTSSNKWRDTNPDVLDFSQVTGCNIDIQENKTELKREGKDGQRISYNPPQYDYSYDFYMTIYVNHPYFNEMRFRVNNYSIQIKNDIVGNITHTQTHTQQHRPASNQARQVANGKPANNRPSNQNMGRPSQGHSSGQNMMNSIVNGVVSALNQPQSFVPHPENNVDYRECLAITEEIKSALTQVREQIREEQIQANAPKQAVTCPWCGATTIPDANGCCEYCGGSVNA